MALASFKQMLLLLLLLLFTFAQKCSITWQENYKKTEHVQHEKKQKEKKLSNVHNDTVSISTQMADASRYLSWI